MKLICKLEKIVETNTSKGYTFVYMYIPVENPYDKDVKLVVSGANAVDVIENMGLPDQQGDTIEIDFSPKQTQEKLVKK